MKMKALNSKIETLFVVIASIVFIGSFMIGCLFAVAPTTDFGNFVFVAIAFILSGYYLWHKL